MEIVLTGVRGRGVLKPVAGTTALRLAYSFAMTIVGIPALDLVERPLAVETVLAQVVLGTAIEIALPAVVLLAQPLVDLLVLHVDYLVLKVALVDVVVLVSLVALGHVHLDVVLFVVDRLAPPLAVEAVGPMHVKHLVLYRVV